MKRDARETRGAAGKVSGRGIQSVETGGRLLQVLSMSAKPLMLRDLAAAAELTPAQAHAYLVSLRKIELVEQDAASGRYRLGPFALYLGLARLRNSDPYRMASEAIVELAESMNLMVAITVWGQFGPTIVNVQESSRQVHANVKPGGVFSLTGTATGKVFAAFLPDAVIRPAIEEELRAMPEGQRVAAAISREALEQDLRRIRELGFAWTIDRPVPGISAVAAPVWDHVGQLQLAVTVIGPTSVVSCRADGPEARALLACTRELSRRLGHAAA